MNKWAVAAKAERVIESCATVEQLNVALRYFGRVRRLFSKNKKYFDKNIGVFYELHSALSSKYKSIKKQQEADVMEDLAKLIVN